MVTFRDTFEISFAPLTRRSAPRFGAPDDQSFSQQTTGFDVTNQGGRPIHTFALGGQASLEAAVVVPVGIVKFDMADTSFNQPTSQEAAVRERRFAGFDPVHLQRLFSLAGYAHQLRHGRLRTECQFVLTDASRDFGVTGCFQLFFVEIL